MKTQELLDHRNFELWSDLKKTQEIEIQIGDFIEYSVYSIQNKSTIYVPSNKMDSASFTHELLHIYIRSKEIYIGGGLFNRIKANNALSKIFSNSLLDHISNCLEHIKMYPIFIELGYNNEDFLSDFNVSKLTLKDVKKIKDNFLHTSFFRRWYSANSIDFYLGKYFAVISCPNLNYDYSFVLNELKRIDSNLFEILETFRKEWSNFDIENPNAVVGGYHIFLSDFVSNLLQWTEGKIIK